MDFHVQLRIVIFKRMQASERGMRRQSEAQITGREGERWFYSMLPKEWSLQRPLDDFGIDGIVAIGDTSKLLPLEFGVQIKSSAHLKMVRGKIVAPKVSREELLYWAGKFYPTLLVVYDSKKKVGYFEWIANLISADKVRPEQKYFYLHLGSNRRISEDCWKAIKSELVKFHEDFSEAFQAKFELLPIVATLATLLRNLCVSATADIKNEDGRILYATAQAWTHIEVVRQLDIIIPKTLAGTFLRHTLIRFRTAYVEKCESIFLKFSELIGSDGPSWIMMKRPEQSEEILKDLAAMLSECVSGLLVAAN